MSIVSWLLKSKKEMKKENTSRVKLGKYTITSHAQNRIADPKRKLKKSDMVINLFGNSTNSKLYLQDGHYQYDRLNKHNKTVTHITKENAVKTIRRFHSGKATYNKEIKKLKGR